MGIHIEIQRPFALAVVLAGMTSSFLFLTTGQQVTVRAQLSANEETDVLQGTGGDELSPQLVIHTAENDIRRARGEREVLLRREEILRYQIDRLEQERTLMKQDLSGESDEEFRATLRSLMDLLEDRTKAEERILEGYREIWQAQENAIAAAQIGSDNPHIDLMWPVEPVYGISATFDDQSYKEIFGLAHKAIDIPALQETTVVAAEDGVVESVVDNGFGFNYIVIRHDGYATMYGHVSAFYVEKGNKVLQGDPIAKSGGMPGTKGAGNLSTGPHVHFEVITGEGHVNPLKYLPIAGVSIGE